MTKKRGKLYILSGPSGAGKSTVISHVIKNRDDLSFSVSATTRQPREGETEGTDYCFITHEEFKKMISDGEFLEYAEYVGSLYGTPREPVIKSLNSGRSIVLDIETQGARQVIKSMPEAITIFLLPPSLTELEQRLRYRNLDSEEKIVRRMETAKRELQEASNYDYIVINADKETAAYEIDSIITAEKCKTENRTEFINK
ncbi:MAG: guanylate kinase [Oscillospiraceae bacterium]|nr:guanylate kinase [Oscillospiraceae bacterium]